MAKYRGSLVYLALIALLSCAAIRVGRNVTTAHAQSAVITTVSDITCDGSVHAFASGTGAFADIVALAANSGTVRFGDSNVGASRGVPIAAGGTYRVNLNNSSTSLSAFSYSCSNGDKISVTFTNTR